MLDSQSLLMSANLGARKDEYKTSPILWIAYSIVFIIIIVSCIYIYLNTNSFLYIVLITFALPLTFMLVIFGVTLYRDGNVRVFVHEHGLLYQRRKTMREIPWSQIAFIWHTATRTKSSVNHSYKLECMDGSTLKLRNSIFRLKELGKTIEIESARFLIPAVQKTFQAGQTVAFGNLLVQQSGLRWRNNQILWQEIQSFEVDDEYGQIKIKKHGQIFKWAIIPTRKVPNVEVLKTVISPYIAG